MCSERKQTLFARGLPREDVWDRGLRCCLSRIKRLYRGRRLNEKGGRLQRLGPYHPQGCFDKDGRLHGQIEVTRSGCGGSFTHPVRYLLACAFRTEV